MRDYLYVYIVMSDYLWLLYMIIYHYCVYVNNYLWLLCLCKYLFMIIMIICDYFMIIVIYVNNNLWLFLIICYY